LEPERRVLCLEIHLRQLAARRELAVPDIRERGGDVEMLAEREIDEERGDERDVGPPQDREQDLERAWAQGRSQRSCQRGGDERARLVAVAGELDDLRQQ